MSVDRDGLRTPLGRTLEQQGYLMAHEALMNAADPRARPRSGWKAPLETGSCESRSWTTGTASRSSGAATGKGPVSLRDRATALGGSLVVDSSEKGVRVEITVPLGAGGA